MLCWVTQVRVDKKRIFPDLAIKIARLAAMVLFPSRGVALVITRVRSGSIAEKPIFVRNMR